LSAEIILSLTITIPPIKEQKKIAQMLNIWDTLIEKQTQLISAKEKNKKALMQKLLSSATRFEKSKWSRLSFGEIFEFISTHACSREQLTYDVTDSGIQNIHYGDIHATFTKEILDLDREDSLPYVIDNAISDKKFSLLQDGDLIIADASEDYNGVGECVELKNVGERKIVGGLHVFVARDKSGKTAPGFRTYLFANHQVSTELKKLATGVSVHSISKTNLLDLELVLPTIEEQKLIASFFHTLDEEIASLNAELNAFKKQKKGLMQNLLTGKIRVKV
jgi:type I restriction enzyme S subunit